MEELATRIYGIFLNLTYQEFSTLREAQHATEFLAVECTFYANYEATFIQFKPQRFLGRYWCPGAEVNGVKLEITGLEIDGMDCINANHPIEAIITSAFGRIISVKSQQTGIEGFMELVKKVLYFSGPHVFTPEDREKEVAMLKEKINKLLGGDDFDLMIEA